MTIQLTPASPTPDHETVAPNRTGRVTRVLSSHPKRSLLAVFLFVLVAGFFGGPVAGSLESSGGFAAHDADSVQAIERLQGASGAGRNAGLAANAACSGQAIGRLQGASGKAPTAGLVVLVDAPDGLPADADRVAEVTAVLAADPDIAEVTSPTTTRGDPAGLVSADGTQV